MERLPDRGEIVQLDFVRREKNKRKHCECKDARFIIDEQNDVVECAICGAMVTYKFALCKIADLDSKRNEIIQKMREQAEDIQNYKPHLKIIKSLESYWSRRGRSQVVPLCPACSEPFLLEELITWVGRQFAEGRIAKRKEKGI